MPSTTSRRGLLAGLVAGLPVAAAGCLGSDERLANCASRGEHLEDGPLEDVKPIDGTERLALGILVDADAPSDDSIAAVVVRNRDGDLVADVPIADNRDMSDLDTDVDSYFRGDGELYAVPLGPPPQHAVFDLEVLDPDGEVVQTVHIEFNCYAADGELP